MPNFIRRMRTRPPLRTDVDESYFEKLLRNIPADIIAGWTALQGIIIDQAGNSPTIQWIVFGVLLTLTPLYVCFMKTTPPGFMANKIFPCLSSVVAFSVWVFALGGPFAAEWRMTAEGGSIESPSKITIASKEDVIIRGGDFRAPRVAFDAEKKLDVYAHSIEGKASVKGGAITFGVQSGELNVVEHICNGDPVYWNEGTGDMTLADITSAGEDVVIWSNGANIYVKNIDTTGGTGPGRVTIITNAGATKPGDDSPYSCSDCSAYIPTGGGGGTVHGLDYFNVDAKGSIEIRGNIQTPEDSVRLISGDKVRVNGDIKTSMPGERNGAVEIRSYKDAGSSTEFVIGGTGHANGVNGNIDASTTGAGYGGVTFIFVKNYAAGGIKVENPAALKVQAGTGRAGIIALDATDGPLSFSAGTLSVDGVAGEQAGKIFIVGDSVAATTGLTTVTASDGGGFLSTFPNTVDISASTVSSGANGLTVKANGGVGNNNGIIVLPKDAYAFSTVWNPPNAHTLSVAGGNPQTQDLTINGSGPLKLEANTFNNGRRQVLVSAGDLSFLGGSVEIESNGKWRSDWYGRVIIGADHLKFGGGPVTIKSNGYQGSDGAEVFVFCKTFERTSDSTLAIHADGDGKGNGGYILFVAREPGTIPITLGTTAGTVRMSADGGASDGNGGRIAIESGVWFVTPRISGAPIVIKDSSDQQNPVLSVSPKGTDGDAGYISVNCVGNITFTQSNNEIHADGKGNGHGGTVIMEAVGTGSTLSLADNIISAKGGITGDGGKISLTSNTDLTMKAAKLLVTVGQDARSNGRGGRIEGTSEAGDITVEGTLNADGKGKGKGGTIRLDANQELQYGTNDFTAKGGNKGDGGTIILKSGENFTIAGSKTHVDVGQDNDSNGEGGTIQIESGADLTITGTMNANGKGKGKGGNILLRAEETLTRSNTTLHADGGCNGHGGVISSSGDAIDHANGIATAKAGDGNCSLLRSFVNSQGTKGGDYTLEVRGFGPATLELTDDIDVTGMGPDGSGGSVLITTPGAFAFGSHSIKADGANGGGGTIVILCGSDLTLNATKVSAKAGSENGKGGIIAVSVKQKPNQVGGSEVLTLNGTFDVSGNGTGDGGHLLFGADTKIILGNGVTFSADGGDGGAEGGSVQLFSGEKVDLSERTSLFINAKGTHDKRGGEIVISRAKSRRSNGIEGIDVRTLFDVDGGPNLQANKLDGKITLNNVETRQLRTSAYPITFWSASFREPNRQILLAGAVDKVHSRMQNHLGDRKVSLYVHDTPEKVDTFFGYETKKLRLHPSTPGVTFQVGNNPPVNGLPIYVNAMLSTSLGEQSDIKFSEVSQHELGHAIDYSLGGAGMLSKDDYDRLVRQSLFNLDYSIGKSTKLASVRRSPCTSPALMNVHNSKGQSVCIGGNLRPEYRNWTNSLIAEFYANHIFQKNGDASGWAELYCQSFAFVTYVQPEVTDLTLTGDANANFILSSGFVPWILDYAKQLRDGNLHPRVNCNIVLPPWYYVADRNP